MKNLVFALSIALTACTPYYTGLGIAYTEVSVSGGIKTAYHHRSLGLGVFSVPGVPYRELVLGYAATRISVFNPRNALIEMKEFDLMKDVAVPTGLPEQPN